MRPFMVDVAFLGLSICTEAFIGLSQEVPMVGYTLDVAATLI